MPEYVIHLANGRELVLEGDQPPSDTDIEQAADSAGVRALLMSSQGEAPAGPSGILAALSGLAGAGGAVAPAFVSAGGRMLASRAAGIVPAAVAFDAAGDALQGDYKRAAGKGAAAYATTQAAKLLPGATRIAAGARLTSPVAVMGSVVAAGHAAKMDPNNQPRTRTLSAREIAEEEIKRITAGGM